LTCEFAIPFGLVRQIPLDGTRSRIVEPPARSERVLEDNMGKGISLRTAVIIGTAVSAGSAAGGTAEVLAQFADHPLPFLGQVVTGAVTLWFAEKLDRVIADDSNGN
jgi:hypothetical protein